MIWVRDDSYIDPRWHRREWEVAEKDLKMTSWSPARFTGREVDTGSWREDAELGAVHTEAEVTCDMRVAGTVIPGECERHPGASPPLNPAPWCPAHCSPAYLECPLSPRLASHDTNYLDYPEFLKACCLPGALLGAWGTSSH